jgi:sugar lactone lactonase YvrE
MPPSIPYKSCLSGTLKNIMMKTAPVCSSLLLALSALGVACTPANAQGPAPILAQVPFVSAFAGNAGGALVAPCSSTTDLVTLGGAHNGDGCAAVNAVLSTPYGASIDSYGNVYFADEAHNYVRVIYKGGAAAAAMIRAANPAYPSLAPTPGYIYALAGGLTASISNKNTDLSLACGNVVGNGDAENSSGDGCPGTQAYINGPYGAAVDSAGDVFLADRGGSKIHVVYAGGALAAALISLETPSVTSPQIGYIYLIAGGSSGYADAVLASAGKVKNPGGLVVDGNENLYIADTGNNAVRMINGPNTTTAVSPGYIHTIGGNCTTSACTALSGVPSNDTAAVGAAFSAPQGIGVDSAGNVYIADGSAVAGSTVRVIYAGGANNAAASLICIENGTSGYSVFPGSCSASTLTANYVYTVAGKATSVTGTTGNGGFAAAAQFYKLTGLAVDKSGNIYVGDIGAPSIVAEINAGTGYIVFLAGGGQATNAAVTVGSYCAPAATSGVTATDIDGNGCPGPQSYTHHVEGNLAVDASGNSDSTNNLIRELKFDNTFTSTTPSSTTTQQLAFALLPTTTSVVLGTPTVLVQGASSTGFTDATANDTCTNGTTLYGAPTASDNTVCIVNVAFAPTKAGSLSGFVEVPGTGIPTAASYISGIGLGPEIAIDPATALTFGTQSKPQGVTTDASGNTYIASASSGSISGVGGSQLGVVAVGLSAPYQIAVDGAGNVYAADSGNNRIAEFYAGSGVESTIVAGLSGPKGLALDALGNLYIADTGNARVLFHPNGNGEQTVLGSGFTTPVAVAVDSSNNVYVADAGLGAIVEIAAITATQTILLSGISPVGIAVDAAGDIYYVDSALKQVIEVPLSGAKTAVVTGLTTPVGIALDLNGGLYVADTANTGVSYYNRTSSTQSFASISTVLAANLTNIGNQSYAETNSSFTQTDSTDFSVTAAASNGCNFVSPITAGMNCAMSAQFTPTQGGPLADKVTFSGNAVNAGSVVLNLSGTGVVTVSTTTTLGSLIPASPVYGQSVQVTGTVTPASGATKPTGNIAFTVDGVAQTPVALTNGAYTLTLPSLSAGSHTISASYAGGGNFSGSTTTTPLTFTVAPLAITATTTSVSFIYGQTVPTLTGSLSGVLSKDSANVTPVFSTTATSTSPVSSYPISVSLTGSATSNYTVTLNGAPTVTVQQATITVVVANATRLYGAANPTFTGAFTGVLTADQANVAGVFSTTATTTSPVNAYPIAATGLTGSAAGNYKLGTVTNGTLTVTPVALTTTATPVSFIYGQAVPALTGSALSGVLAQDNGNVTAVFTTTATSTSSIGTYPISVSLTGSAAGNYTVSLTTPAVVTVQAATVTVAVNGATRAYGLANPTFTGVLTGVLSQDSANVAAVYSTTATTTSSVATYPITTTSLTGSAAGNYKLGTVTAGTLTVTQAGTTTALVETSTSVVEGTPASFTATVASTTSGTPTGSVTFYNGTTSIGTTTLSGGVANFSISSLPYGSQSITAVYGGSTNFSTSTSSAVTEGITLPIVTTITSASTVTVAPGGTGTVTLTVAPQGNYTGTVTYSCAFLPADMTCSFSPASSTITSTTTTATTTLTISTSTAAALLQAPRLPGRNHSLPTLALMAFGLPGSLLALFGMRRRKPLQRLLVLVVMLTGFAGMAGLTGCGSSSPGTKNTPAGTYTIDIEITAGTVQTVPLTVVVQ